ncbi:MAG TPA: acyltransferase family protein [Candidatus Gallacutalibacter stercoravium]|nr:acyltransferase family protein [Candidatus Gallacutalibacter stercoravium]
MDKQRIFWLDVARALAITSVAFNHALNRVYATFSGQLEETMVLSSFSLGFKTFISIFSRLGVPLFLMITGALILQKEMNAEKNVRRFYKHNLLPLVITAEIWYALMYVFYCGEQYVLQHNPMPSIGELLLGFVKNQLLIDQHTFGSMWYMPMIIGVYLMLPFFCALVKKLSWKTMLIPCAATLFATMIIPNLNSFFCRAGTGDHLEFFRRFCQFANVSFVCVCRLLY